MKKKELLELPPVPCPFRPNTKAGAFSNRFYLTARLVRTNEGKTIEIDGYHERTGELAFRHFTSRKSWLTWAAGQGGSDPRWNRDGLYTILANWHGRGTARRADDLPQLVQEFLGKEVRYSPEGVIEDFERDLREKALRRSNERRQQRINRLMKDTPKLPGDFRRFCRKLVAGGDRKYLKLFQPLQCGEKIERIFMVERLEPFEVNHEDRLRVTEICRAYTDHYGDQWKSWYYGEYFGRAGVNQRFWDRKCGLINNLPSKHYIYDNLDDLDMTPAQRSVLRIVNGKADPSFILNRLHFHPELEMLVKSGFIRYSLDRLGDPHAAAEELIQLPAGQRDRLRKFDGGKYAFEMLRVDPRITDANLREFCRCKLEAKAETLIDIVRSGLNINHVMNLLQKTGGLTFDNIRKYADYLDMAEQQGMNVHDEIIYRNKRWHEFHDRYLEELNRQMNEEREEIRKAELKEKEHQFEGIERDYSLNCRIFAYEDQESDCLIIIPHSYRDIVEEGQKQHHCVGASDHYMLNMANRRSFILFLRKKENPEKPYYTIETDGQRVLQFYAAYDRQPDKKAVSEILGRWMEQVRKNMKTAKEAV